MQFCDLAFTPGWAVPASGPAAPHSNDHLVEHGLLVDSERKAYRFVSVAVMLAEANLWAQRLLLPIQLPLKRADLRSEFVAMPNVATGGSLVTEDYFFGFRESLFLLAKLAPFGATGDMAERYRLLACSAATMNSGEAYLRAAAVLEKLAVNVRELEQTNHPEVRQRVALLDGQEQPLPVFFVRWGDWEEAKIEVEIDGRTGSLVELRFNDASLCQRPAQPIVNPELLLGVPDQEFDSYTEAQRQSLISRFTSPSEPKTQAKAGHPATP